MANLANGLKELIGKYLRRYRTKQLVNFLIESEKKRLGIEPYTATEIITSNYGRTDNNSAGKL